MEEVKQISIKKTYLKSDKRGQKEIMDKISQDSQYMIALKRGEDLTKFKHDYYKNMFEVKDSLLNERISKKGKFSFLTKIINPFIEKENELEILRLENELHSNMKMLNSYEERVKQDEDFIEKMAEETNNCFEDILKEASNLQYNLRLQNAIDDFSKKEEQNLINQRNKIEFYIYLKSEIKNAIIHKY